MMTGISGFLCRDQGMNSQEIFDNVLNRSLDNLSSENRLQKKIIGHLGGIGLLCSPYSEKYSDSFAYDHECFCFIHGEMYGKDASTLVTDYLNERTSLSFDLARADGAFTGLLYDNTRETLFVFSDFFGLEPLFFTLQGDIFAFSSQIRNLLVIPGIDKTMDEDTLASFWNFGCAMLDHTPFKSVRLLPPGSILTFDLKNWEMEIKGYDTLARMFKGRKTDNLNSEWMDVVRAFQKSVDRRSDDADTMRLGLSLSGGLDSRLILGGLRDRAKHVKTYTLGLKGCADEKLAGRLAVACGCHQDFIPIRESELTDFKSLAETLVVMSDGLYHPHESTEKVALDYLSTLPFDVMLRGHGGEIAKAALAYPFQAEPSMRGMNTWDIIETLYRKSSLARKDIDMKAVLGKDIHNKIKESSWDMFKKAVEPAIDEGVAGTDLCIYLYIDQWIRRQVVSSLALFRSRVGIRLPFLDKDFVNTLLRIPADKRWAGEFHRYFIHHMSPHLEKIPDSNTGAPLDAGPLRLLITDKVNSVLKKVGVKGFRHYTEFQKWQRKYFSDVTRSILFSDQCLDRGYYHQDGLKDIFERHISGKKDYAHFIGTAVAIELWHRTFVD